ncbi:3-hydroxyacyl-CoA dehydrogenase [Moorella glycerini]|uniref:3-hydroxybutyryl-CoA dehydrogenase n=1 Tax=Neomoorella stamsii TaxID=1266720 RepID=A0A9X7P698_9FIRM|nr:MULTISPECIES: 3-hydroxyacyl-CoA dehydrogenase family protein [Moorella]PRR72670.1 putative 3-hydroxybutyryl-CoA dehydrogenase [Moorella stamsii]CEP68186.1 3-hydroxyacyl-CoA dehydrogenase [Moorella glycerini]
MQLEDIKEIAVLGTGTMGHGIALLCALAGYQVRLLGRSEDSLNRGFRQIRSGLELLAKGGLVEASRTEGVMTNIKGFTTLAEAVTGVDFVIEAIVEDLAVKQGVFREVDALVPPHTILASTTSGLDPTKLAALTRRPERVVVTHFWNPPHLLPLVEIVRGEKTADATVGLARALVARLGKKPIEVKKAIPGFVGNRLQFALLREALYIVEQGWATAEDVDAAVKYSFGRRLAVTGPLESADLGGLDVFYNIQSYLNQDLCHERGPSQLLKEKVERGELGVKTGRGFYDWQDERVLSIKKAREEDLIKRLQEDKF